MALERLQLNLSKVKDTTSPAGAAVAALGLNAKELIALPIPEQMNVIADAVSRFADGGQKTAIVMALLGRGGAQMIPVLDQGRAGLESLGEVAERAGTAMDDLTKKGLAETGRETKELGMSFQGLGITIFSIFKPAFDGLLQGLIDLVQGFNDALKSGGMLRDLLDMLAFAFKSLVSALIFVTGGLKALWDTAILVVDEIGLAFMGLSKLIYNTMTFNWSGTKEAFSNLMDDMKTRAATWTVDIVKDATAAVKELDKVWGSATPDAEKVKKPAAPAMDMSGGNLDVAAKELDGEIKLMQQWLGSKKQILQQDLAQHKITTEQELQALQDYTDDAYDEERDLLTAKMALYAQGTKEYQEALNKRKELDAKYATDSQKIQGEAVANIQKQYQAIGNAIESSFNSQLRGLLAGTTSFGQAFKNMIGNLIIMFIEACEKMAVEWVVKEATQTTATATGVAARTSAEATGATASAGISFAAAFKSIMASASQTFAGIFAFLSPAMGPAAAAPATAGEATVTAVAASIPQLAVGAWDVDKDMVAQLHQGETVAPAAVAPYVRDFLSGGGPGNSGGDTFHLNIQAVDASSVRRLFMQQGSALVKSLQNQIRMGATA